MRKAKSKIAIPEKKSITPKPKTKRGRPKGAKSKVSADKSLPAQIVISKMYKDRGIVTLEEGGTSELIKVAPVVSGVPVCHVEYASQMTVNLGNFESVQCRVGVTLPAYLEEAEEAYQVAQTFVDNRLTRVVDEIKEYREKSRGVE